MDLIKSVMLGAVLSSHFPALHARNDGDMKWKKFFYRQLCLKEEILICKSPTCAQCTDHAECFGPEDTPHRPEGAAFR